MAFTLPPPVQNHLIHLLAQGLHVGIGKAGVQRAHVVGVGAGSADGAVELGLAHLAGRALGAVAAIAAVVPAWDGELKAHVRPIEAHTYRGLLSGIERRHAIDDGLGKGWALGSVVAGWALAAVIALWALAAIAAVAAIHPVTAAWDVEGEAHVRSIEAHIHGGGYAGLDGVHAVHHRTRKRRTCGADESGQSFLALWDFKAEVQRVAHHVHARVRGAALRQRGRAVHLRGGHSQDGINDGFESIELTAHLHRIGGRVFLG